MSSFLRLEDSPMFQKQICSLEHMADDMKNRCQILYKGSKKFLAALGEACIGDNSFADSLEAFGGWKDDSVSLTIEGPIMSKFINAFRELASYKEMLCSQVEHVLVDRLTNIMNIDFQDVKESRRRFDKAISAYDQAREKFVSLKKNTPEDIVAELEEDLQNSKSAFERSRFNLVNALMTIEAKKKYEFLESISAIMDSHLKYFKLGYELLKQLEPFIQQVYTYSQQAKESATAEQCNLEKRIQEFTQTEMDTVKKASSQVEASTCSGGICVTGLNPDKNIEAIMQSSINGEVQTIKQGYLLKRSSSLRGDWKRRFFVLDSQGTLYYYRNKGIKPMGFLGHYAGTTEHNSGVFSRFRVKKKGPSVEDMSSGCRTVDLRTSTIKMDAEDTDLRLCFRIISPMKTLTLQAEHGSDLMDWVNKITAVITSLLNSHIQQQHVESSDYVPHNNHGTSDDQTGTVSAALREIPGNDVCAECNAGEPDWASLNLGVLICIECSGVHRNLGVHISKVRSLTLDVKAWEPTIVELFCSLGNTYCNSIWEGSLLENERVDESKARNTSITKPCPKDSFLLKEKFIYAKYVYKMLMTRDPVQFKASPRTTDIWEAVESDNLRQVYRLIATASGTNIVNTTFDDVFDANLYYHVVDAKEPSIVSLDDQWIQNDPLACQRIWDSNDPGSCLQGCSLLHLACQCGNPVMVDLLLQFGADINMRDYHGRTPLHHCIALGKNTLAKHLLRRGASSSKRDGGGFSSLDRAMEKGAISDEWLLISLSESN